MNELTYQLLRNFQNISSLPTRVVIFESLNGHCCLNWAGYTQGHTFGSYCMTIKKVEILKILALLIRVVIFENFNFLNWGRITLLRKFEQVLRDSNPSGLTLEISHLNSLTI